MSIPYFDPELATKIAKVFEDSILLGELINGDINTTVTLEDGRTLPSVAKFIGADTSTTFAGTKAINASPDADFPSRKVEITTPDGAVVSSAPINVGASAVLNEGNDGSNSGIDVDLLDGHDSGYYIYAPNFNAGTVPRARLSGTYNIDIAGTTPVATNINLFGGQSASYYLNPANKTLGALLPARIPAGNYTGLDAGYVYNNAQTAAGLPVIIQVAKTSSSTPTTITGGLTYSNSAVDLSVGNPATSIVSIDFTPKSNNSELIFYFDASVYPSFTSHPDTAAYIGIFRNNMLIHSVVVPLVSIDADRPLVANNQKMGIYRNTSTSQATFVLAIGYLVVPGGNPAGSFTLKVNPTTFSDTTVPSGTLDTTFMIQEVINKGSIQ